MDHELQIAAPLEHPCYAGHFPGRPIVPGVVLLDLIVEALDRGAPRAIGHVKFLGAVLPGESVTVRYGVVGPRVDFHCVRGEQRLVEGSLSFATAPADPRA